MTPLLSGRASARCASVSAARFRGDRGAASTELVIAMPLLLLLVTVSMHVGLWFHARHVVNAATQEGARAARALGATDADGQLRAQQMLDELGGSLTDTRITVERAGGVVTVRVTADAPPVGPGLTLGVDAATSSPVEEFRP
jgi:Flp pilus assembly protein TadG